MGDPSRLRTADSEREALAEELRGASGSFWPIWVIIFALLPLLRDGWRLFGPAPDERAVEAHLRARRTHRMARERRHSERRLPR